MQHFSNETSVLLGMLHSFLHCRQMTFQAASLQDFDQKTLAVTFQDVTASTDSLDRKIVTSVSMPHFQTERISKAELKKSCCRIFGGFLVLLLVSIPAIVPNIALNLFKTSLVYVSYSPALNSTKIIKAIALNQPMINLHGCLKYEEFEMESRTEDLYQESCNLGCVLLSALDIITNTNSA